MNIEIDRMHRLDGTGAVKAFVDVKISFGDQVSAEVNEIMAEHLSDLREKPEEDKLEHFILIKGFSVVMGRNGLFVSPPRKQGKDQQWFDTMKFSDRLKSEIESILIETYEEPQPAGGAEEETPF